MISLWLFALALGEEPLQVRWEAPQPHCASQAEMQRRLADRLGPRLAAVQRLEVGGVVTESESGLDLRLTVVVDGETTERDLQAPVCEELVRATELIASLAVEPAQEPEDATEPPVVASDSAAPSTEDEPPDEVAAEPLPTAVESSAPPQPPPSIGAAVRAGAGVSIGRRPSASAMFTAGAGAHGRLWLVRLDLSYGPSQQVRLPVAADRGAAVESWIVSVDGGVRVPLTPWLAMPATAGVDVGALVAEGFGVSTTARGAQPWIAPAFGVGLDFRLTRWLEFWVAARGAVALVQPAFEIEGQGTLFRSAVGSIGGAGGIAVRVR